MGTDRKVFLMTGRMMLESFFQCVLCNGKLKEDHLQSFVCCVCDAVYPTIDDISILVLNPNALLTAHLAEMAEQAMSLQKRSHLFATMEGAMSPESLSRLNRSFNGLAANQELGRELFKPIQEYLADQRAEANLLWFLTSYPIGWSLNQLVPYFYRDWSGTKEASDMGKLFTDAVKDHCGDLRQSVAVLGTGASGLLYRLSEFFSYSFGIDLSVPALLLAKHVMRGEEIDLHLNVPYNRFPKVQRRIRVQGPAKQVNGIKLLAADVNNLPFLPSSLSCVITQYIMDLVHDQAMLASEINRVLAPGGVWINYGIPAGLTEFDMPNHLDLPWFFNQTGFHPLDISLKPCNHLDFSEISEWRETVTHNNIFFVVRKKCNSDYQSSNPFIAYFSSGQREILNRSLKLSRRFEISISKKTEYSDTGTRTKNAIEIPNVGDAPFTIDVPAEVATFLDELLQMADGSYSIKEIVERINAGYGEVFKEKEIMLALRALFDSRILLTEPE